MWKDYCMPSFIGVLRGRHEQADQGPRDVDRFGAHLCQFEANWVSMLSTPSAPTSPSTWRPLFAHKEHL